MNALPGIALACLFVTAPGARGQSPWRERAPVPPDGSAVDHATGGDFAGVDSVSALEPVLSLVALEHGERARLWQYGESTSGHPLLALELSAVGGPLGEGGPTVIVVPDLAGDPAAGVREVIAGAHRLVVDDERLAHARWLLVPAPLPERLEGGGPGGTPQWDFPSGWHPWNTPGASTYPLSSPETRALARGLAAWPGAAVLTVLGERPREGGGSLEDFARSRGLAVWTAPDLEGAARAALELLPRAGLGEVRVERLAVDLWQVDLELRLDGTCDGARLGTLGLELVAAASAREGGEYAALPVDRERSLARLGPLGSGVYGTRLLVKGEPGERLTIRLSGEGLAPRRRDLVLAVPSRRD